MRLRAATFEDWEDAYVDMFDSKARFFLEEEIELPPVPATVREQSEKYTVFNQETGRLMFTIDTLDGIVVGGLNLNGINERNGTFGIGIQIGMEYRDKGYGTAAMRILLKYTFLERRLNKFNSGCVEGNVASITMHKKFSYVQEGVRRQMYYSNERYFN